MWPAMLGVAMGTMTAGFMLGSCLAGRCGPYFARTTLMIAGRLVACGGLVLGLALLLLGIVQAVTLFGACVLVGLGNGVTIPGSSAGALSVRPDRKSTRLNSSH